MKSVSGESNVVSAPNVLKRVAVVICTKDRPSIAALMESIGRCPMGPKGVVVVDASTGQTPGHVSIERKFGTRIPVFRIGSDAGLPHQRNIGISFVFSQTEFQDCDVISFLDDDVEVSPDYFDELVKCFDTDENLICVGAVDDALREKRRVRLALRIALVDAKSRGKLLRSGFATLPSASGHLIATDWVPGLAMSFRRHLFNSHRFDERIAFYGEDLEFQLRIGHLGKIAISSQLHVVHNQSLLSRDSLRDHWSYSDGFRWSLTDKFPNRVRKSAVLWSVLALMVLESARFIVGLPCRVPDAFLGHSDFLRRLVMRSEVEKLRGK